MILPFWTSYLLRVYAWVAILGDHGAINSLLKALGLTHEPIRLFLYDNPGVFIVLVYLYFPFAALTLYASLETVRLELLHAAVDLGATPMRAIVNTLLPQMRLAIVTAGIFVFIPILGEYLAPAAIGGTQRRDDGQPGCQLLLRLSTSTRVSGQCADRAGHPDRADRVPSESRYEGHLWLTIFRP